jgi:hypothetical protein
LSDLWSVISTDFESSAFFMLRLFNLLALNEEFLWGEVIMFAIYFLLTSSTASSNE